jgi:putative flippase GtrA
MLTLFGKPLISAIKGHVVPHADRSVARGSSLTWADASAFGEWVLVVRARVLELCRYFLASLIALGLDIGVFTGLVWFDVMPVVLAGALSYVAGLALHFVLSVIFVFATGTAGKSIGRKLGEFLLSGVAGLALTALTLFLVVNLIGFSPFAGKAMAVGASFLCVYLIRAKVVFA